MINFLSIASSVKPMICVLSKIQNDKIIIQISEISENFDQNGHSS